MMPANKSISVPDRRMLYGLFRFSVYRVPPLDERENKKEGRERGRGEGGRGKGREIRKLGKGGRKG